ncbi:hypothetical protein BJ875DRAFT_287262 [Amylocarpus encephaloides]|uniref:Uncharacterized protein n=1 Tax=Amylocarpus encephaloides TaxID=45428 RepID=A0A9P7YL33_9HELO|nr:hypothetical protein BJ875DRAFT_287262 [Amylocarpus encephaloides]
MSTPIKHIHGAQTTRLPIGPLSLRVLNSTAHHILLTCTLAPHSCGFPLLGNTKVSATFHLVRGSARFSTCSHNSLDAQVDEVDVAEGSTISAPPHSFYGFGNPFEEEVEIFCVYSPGSWLGALEEWSAFAASNPWTGEEGKEIMRKAGCIFPGDEPHPEDDDDEELAFSPGLRCMA